VTTFTFTRVEALGTISNTVVINIINNYYRTNYKTHRGRV